MGLINLLLKALILVLDLRDTYDALDAVKLDEIGRHERQVPVRNAEDRTKRTTNRRRIGTSKRKATVKSALTTVLVWNLFNKFEPLCDRTIAWFVPFYDSFKTLFLIWMLFTRSYGASILVYRFLTPIIRPYESIIDGIIALTLALFGWAAALLASCVHRCAAFIQAIISARPQSAQPLTTSSSVATISHDQAGRLKRHTLTASTAEKAQKKPPPPPSSPPAHIKNSPASISLMPGADVQLQPGLDRAKSRQIPTKKRSHGSLAETRRVLQELPVPTHAFDSTFPPTSASVLHAPSASNAVSAPSAAAFLAPKGAVKTAPTKAEPSEHNMGSPNTELEAVQSSGLGPIPTPPNGLRNYAFIPGMTPQRSGPSSLVSPTPRFPGGFSFSLAPPQASTSIGGNPFQPQAMLPPTTQMAPLSLSPQTAAPHKPSGRLGVNAGLSNNILTHEMVPSAHDDRIVLPPNGSVAVRKISSSRSLKGKVAAKAQTEEKSSTSLSGRKRSRADETTEGRDPKSETISSRKRTKTVPGKATASKTAAGSATAKARPQTKRTPTTVAGRPAQRKKIAANVAQHAAKKPAVLEARAEGDSSGPMVAGQNSKTKTTSSPRKKAKSSASSSDATSSKTTASRAVGKKTSTARKARSESAEVTETSELPQRLTRSRTKQNLAG